MLSADSPETQERAGPAHNIEAKAVMELPMRLSIEGTENEPTSDMTKLATWCQGRISVLCPIKTLLSLVSQSPVRCFGGSASLTLILASITSSQLCISLKYETPVPSKPIEYFPQKSSHNE